MTKREKKMPWHQPSAAGWTNNGAIMAPFARKSRSFSQIFAQLNALRLGRPCWSFVSTFVIHQRFSHWSACCFSFHFLVIFIYSLACSQKILIIAKFGEFLADMWHDWRMKICTEWKPYCFPSRHQYLWRCHQEVVHSHLGLVITLFSRVDFWRNLCH